MSGDALGIPVMLFIVFTGVSVNGYAGIVFVCCFFKFEGKSYGVLESMLISACLVFRDAIMNSNTGK